MEFLTPVLFGGLALISAPILIHLLHRRNVKPVDWAAMRFLIEMMTRKRRRIFLNELLLLLLRVALITCIALAMVRPAWKQTAVANGNNLVRQGRTAAVLLVDDCLSTQAGRAQTSFEGMKRLAVSYLTTLTPGDEISVLLMSQLGQAAADPEFDIESVKSAVLAAKPGYVSSDVPRLLEAGLAQLKRHANPGAEIVLITDGMKSGWRWDEVSRWEELRKRLRGPASAPEGTKARPRLLLLCPETSEPMRNLSITALQPDRSVITTSGTAEFQVSLKSRGHTAPQPAVVQFLLDGRPVEQKAVEIAQNGEAEVSFSHAFADAGSYSVQARLLDNHDFLAADDQRTLAIQVEPGVPVLLVDGQDKSGLAAKLGFLRYALDPQGKGGSPFKVTYVTLPQLLPSMLADFRVVVLGDLPVLEPTMVDALERFVVGGGGLLVGLGPDSNPALINRAWSRGGEGFFPASLATVVSPAKGGRPGAFNRAHPAFSGFGTRLEEAWKSTQVRSYYSLAPEAQITGELDLVMKLDNGDPLVLERRRGLGLVALVTTSLNADWNDLPLQPAFVPLMRGLVGQLGSFIMPPRNLQPAEPLIYAHLGEPGHAITGEDAAGKKLPLTPGGWEGRDAMLSDPLPQPGVYLLRDPKVNKPIRFVVESSPAESALEPASDRELSQALESGTRILRRVEQVTETMAAANRQSIELWKWLLGAAVLLFFVESWMTRRMTLGALAAELKGQKT